MTPKMKNAKDTTLYKKCWKKMKAICSLHKRSKLMKRTKLLKVLNEDESVSYLMKKLTPSVALMLQYQLINLKRKRTVKTWTLEEKIMALKLYKRNATCYRLLQKLWFLPATRLLKSLLNQFPIDTGINDNIFNSLKKHIERKTPSDNGYILIFGEMAIQKHLCYNSEHDKIIGYQDHGSQGRTQEEATHALVFMVVGIQEEIKQPVAFYLSGANVTSHRLACLVKEVLNKCFQDGISISATVCKMNAVNRGAFTILGASKNHPYFNINNNEVVAIFDPPQLLKRFRNLFLKYNLKCNTNITSDHTKGEGIAKWSHIQDFYDVDHIDATFVFAPALRKDHLNPNSRQKKKISLATEVLSHYVAVGMFAKIAHGKLSADATTTAEVISNFDKLFNAVNSDTAAYQRGEPHSKNMTTKTFHLKHFEAMKTFFENLEFVGCQNMPASKDGWIWTLNGIIRVFKNIKEKHRINSLATRRLQLDPLHNLFGTIRTYCGGNSNPTVLQFIDGLKTVIISNLAHLGSGSYCEEDNNKKIMKIFKGMFSSPHSKSQEDCEDFAVEP